LADSTGGANSEHFASFIASHKEIELSLKNLQRLHVDYLHIDRRYQEDLLQLQNKFLAQYNDCFAKRQAIVNGQRDQKGIPGFWLTAVKSNAVVSAAIEHADEEALSFLRDVRVQDLGKIQGFKLIFDFKDNPFFRNGSLSKTFTYGYEDDYTGDLKGNQATGCRIDWHPGKNLTTHASHATSESDDEREKESFFTFFNTLARKETESRTKGGETSGKKEDDDDDEFQLGFQFELGEEFKDSLIPYALYWYTGEAELDESDDDEESTDDDEEDEKDEENNGNDSDSDDTDNDDDEDDSSNDEDAKEDSD